MDDIDSPTSPRKKIKVEHTSSIAESTDTMNTVMMGTAPLHPLQAKAGSEQIEKEEACGITEFVSPDLLGFSGILKKRYTDFLVNEILPSGKVVYIDNLKGPTRPQKEEKQPDAVTHVKQEPNDMPHACHIDATKTDQALVVTKAKAEDVQEENRELEQEKEGTFVGEAIAVPALADAGDGSERTPHTVKPDRGGANVGEKLGSSAEQSSTIPTPMTKDCTAIATSDTSTSAADSSSSQTAASRNSTKNAQKDPLAHHFEKPPPHMRVPLTNPLLVQKPAEVPTESSPETKRIKQKVHLNYTNQGWVENDEEQERQLKEAAAADALEKGQKEDETQNEKEQQAEDKEGELEEKIKEEPAETPKSVYARQASTLASWQAYANVPDRLEISEHDLESLLSYFTPEVVDAIRSLYNRVQNSPLRKAKDHGSVRSAVIDRQLRTTIHQDIRRIFDSKLETVTDGQGAMVITAMTSKPAFHDRAFNTDNGRGNSRGNIRANGRGNDGRRTQAPRGKPRWEDLGGEYLHFSLYKENKDTMESISWLAKQLHIAPKSFDFAGTKDRRAVTVQRVCVKRIFIKQIIEAGKRLRSAYVGNFSYQPQRLQLGELTGNEFVITLRDCNFHYPEDVDNRTLVEGAKLIVGDAIRNLVENGFLNYYGLQRFGTFSTRTDAVGVAMLQGNFQGAVNAILQYNPVLLETIAEPALGADKMSMEDIARARAISSFQTTGNAFPALDILPKKFSAEASIIRHLGNAHQSNDNLGALKSIQRNLRLMYVHAYQSFIWNMAASERWKRFGHRVVAGDLVLINEHKEDVDSRIKEEEVDADGEVIIHPAEDDRTSNIEDSFVRARALSDKEAEGGTYTIFDVVLPTPGFDIIYPPNDIGLFYHDFMASEQGGCLDPYDMRRQEKDMSLSGSYRKVLSRPGKDINFEVKTYENDEEQFVDTDMDRYYKDHPEQDNRQQRQRQVNKLQNPVHKASDPVDDSPTGIKQEVDGRQTDEASEKRSHVSTDTDKSGGVRLDWNGQPKDDKKIAVILKLQLGAGQYATMALRELMKLGGVQTYKADFSGGR